MRHNQDETATVPGADSAVAEQADEATLAALVQIVRRPGWMQLPLLLVFHGDPEGPSAELLAAVREQGDDALLRGQDAAIGVAQDFAWRSLPAEVLRARANRPGLRDPAPRAGYATSVA